MNFHLIKCCGNCAHRRRSIFGYREHQGCPVLGLSDVPPLGVCNCWEENEVSLEPSAEYLKAIADEDALKCGYQCPRCKERVLNEQVQFDSMGRPAWGCQKKCGMVTMENFPPDGCADFAEGDSLMTWP